MTIKHCMLPLLMLWAVSSAQIFAQTDIISISINKKSIDVAYGGEPRINSGAPIVANASSWEKVAQRNDLVVFETGDKKVEVKTTLLKNNIVAFTLDAKGVGALQSSDFAGIFFQNFPQYKQGMAFYRYKPWNSWTKPMRMLAPGELESWDNQCYYWQYHDGIYGVAIPLTMNGYRTTLGSDQGRFGSKALTYVVNDDGNSIPAMAIGFGKDPYLLFKEIYTAALTFMGKSDNLINKKSFPAPMEYIGWCTWNASNLGANLNEKTIFHGVQSFTKQKFPLGWLLVDDGWFTQRSSMLRALRPDSLKFPNGFKTMNQRLKTDYHLRHIGVWHAFNGYWNGIDQSSPLGNQYRNELFSWTQREHVEDEHSNTVTYHFIKPTSDSLKTFYERWHAYLKNEGFTFLKIDNQLVAERMSLNNYPIATLADSIHRAINASVKKSFNNALINCMDMTNDAFYNFGSTPVARSVEDYFPYEENENYNLQRGNAAAHIMQGIYNNLYFSQMVFPDLDMFQSHNPNGEFHAIARAINNGPIYVTDNIGEQKFDILNKLILHDGKILRSDAPLLPTRDCLFQLQDKKIFKGFSKTLNIGLLGVWNCADADAVKGTYSPDDVSIDGDKFAIYEHFNKTFSILDRNERLELSLPRMGYRLFYISPIKNNIAPFGLINKYNAPATIIDYQIGERQMTIRLKESGLFAFASQRKPAKITINKKICKDFSFEKGLCIVKMPTSDREQFVVVDIQQ